ncbi:type 4 pilus major pilin [Stenotrophomonas maltophilia]|uniref:type 4 pilus major pilin n=2 Tax=Stenotrophomonas maltophilia TaxID=40324 RepID=UPI003CE44E3C
MKRRCVGWGLMETLLTLGAISALSLGIYKVLEPARANAQAKSEHDNLRNLSAAVERSWGVLGSFQGVSTQRVIDDALMPSHMFDGQAIRTKWGTSVSVVPRAVSSPGDAFAIVYPLTPADVCSRLVTSVARTTYDVRIDGVSAFTADHPDPGAIAALCGKSNEATLEFVYHSGLVAGSVVAASPLVLPSVSAGVFPPVSGPVDGPVGPVGPVGPAGPVAPVAPAPVAPAPAPITPPPSSGTPVSPVTPGPVSPPPAPVSPPTSPLAACVAPASRTTTEGQTRAICPAGQHGQVTEQRVGTYSYSCPEAWDRPVETFSWAGWTVTSNTCATCPGVQPQQQTQWVATGQGCPTGQEGSHTWEAEQIQTRTGTYNCPAGTATLPGIDWSPWGGWANTDKRRNESNTCAPSAPAFEIKATCSFTGAQTNQGPETWNGGCIQPGQFYMRTSPVSAVFWLTSSVDLSQYAIQWTGDCVGNATSCTAEQVRVSVNSPHDKTATVTVTHRATGQQFTRTVTAQWRVQGIDKGGGGS